MVALPHCRAASAANTINHNVTAVYTGHARPQRTLKRLHGTKNSYRTFSLTMYLPASLNFYDFGYGSSMSICMGVGNLVNWLLHGILTVQLYLYCLAFPNDKTWTKTVIYTVYFLETVQVIGVGTIFLMMISGSSDIFGDGPSFTFSSNPIVTSGYYNNGTGWAIQALLIDVIGGLVPLIAQCIYAHRIRIITQRNVMPWLIITLAVSQFFVAILTGTGVGPVAIIGLCWTGLNMVNDSMIAFIMVRTLSKEKPLFNNTQSKVVRLVRLIIATGLLTVVVNLFCFVIFILLVVSPQATFNLTGWAGVPLLICMPKLYANSMLVMLNNRMTIRKSRDMKTDMTSTNWNVVSMLVISSDPNGPATSHDEVSTVSSLA